MYGLEDCSEFQKISFLKNYRVFFSIKKIILITQLIVVLIEFIYFQTIHEWLCMENVTKLYYKMFVSLNK